MFSRLYRKNKQGYYVYPLYNYLSVWFFDSILVCFIDNFLIKFLDNDFLKFIFLVSFVIGIVKNKGLFKYFRALELAGRIRKALLNTMTLNLYKDSPIIEVPGIRVTFENCQIHVNISKLPGMYNIDMLELIKPLFLRLLVI